MIGRLAWASRAQGPWTGNQCDRGPAAAAIGLQETGKWLRFDKNSKLFQSHVCQRTLDVRRSKLDRCRSLLPALAYEAARMAQQPEDSAYRLKQTKRNDGKVRRAQWPFAGPHFGR
jgi:hypothetical protein